MAEALPPNKLIKKLVKTLPLDRHFLKPLAIKGLFDQHNLSDQGDMKTAMTALLPANEALLQEPMTFGESMTALPINPHHKN